MHEKDRNRVCYYFLDSSRQFFLRKLVQKGIKPDAIREANVCRVKFCGPSVTQKKSLAVGESLGPLFLLSKESNVRIHFWTLQVNPLLPKFSGRDEPEDRVGADSASHWGPTPKCLEKARADAAANEGLGCGKGSGGCGWGVQCKLLDLNYSMIYSSIIM